MAGIGQHNFAFRSENQTETGDKAGALGTQKNIIEALQSCLRGDLFVSHGAKRPHRDSA